MTPMDSPTLLSSSSPRLSEELREQTNQILCKIIRRNYNTQFAQAASELSEFRRTTADLVDRKDDATLSDAFRKMVQLTTYNAYAALIARFNERPCKASAVADLLAPGLPNYIAESSSTSGGAAKRFPVYSIDATSDSESSNAGFSLAPDPLRRRRTAYMWYLWCDRIDAEDEDGRAVKPIYITHGSGSFLRMKWNLDPKKDKERMEIFMRDFTTPHAAAFVRKYRSFLYIHALFAIASRSIESMSMVFIPTFVDVMRLIEEEFDTIVNCIEQGIIPHLEGTEAVRHHLEACFSPDPARAVELRILGPPSSCPGWCSHIWPSLHTVSGIASGSFASSVPLARSYLGPNAHVCSNYYGCTEGAAIGTPYNPRELNQFKMTKDIIIEYLDIGKDDSIGAIAQLWEVEVGRKYEVLLTTQDGLWRYRLGDVVEVAGFDPLEGDPIIQFVERRNVILRFRDCMITEKELRAAMSFASEKSLEHIVDWTATADERQSPATIGFFVELSAHQVSDLFHDVPEYIAGSLSRGNDNVAWSLEHQTLGRPTIWIVRRGTFREFRQMRLDEGSNNVGQIKVPVVLPKAAYVVWFSNRVVREL